MVGREEKKKEAGLSLLAEAASGVSNMDLPPLALKQSELY